MNDTDKQRGDKLDTMWIDIGAADGDAAREIVGIGDLAVIEQPSAMLLGERIVSRAVDNRSGAFVAAESVRLYAESPGSASLVGVASVQEETSFAGAFTAAYGIAPDRRHRRSTSPTPPTIPASRRPASATSSWGSAR